MQEYKVHQGLVEEEDILFLFADSPEQAAIRGLRMLAQSIMYQDNHESPSLSPHFDLKTFADTKGFNEAIREACELGVLVSACGKDEEYHFKSPKDSEAPLFTLNKKRLASVL